jgi:hypothetical protein
LRRKFMSNLDQVLEALGAELDKRKNQMSRPTMLARRYLVHDLPGAVEGFKHNHTIDDTLIDIALSGAANALFANSAGFETTLHFESTHNGLIVPFIQVQDAFKGVMHPRFEALARAQIPIAGWALCKKLGLDSNVRDRCITLVEGESGEIRKLLIEHHSEAMMAKYSPLLRDYLPLIIKLAVEIYRERGRHVAGSVNLNITSSSIAHLVKGTGLEVLGEPGVGIPDRNWFDGYLEAFRHQARASLPALRAEIEADHAQLTAEYGDGFAKLVWGSDLLSELDKVEEQYHCEWRREDDAL